MARQERGTKRVSQPKGGTRLDTMPRRLTFPRLGRQIGVVTIETETKDENERRTQDGLAKQGTRNTRARVGNFWRGGGITVGRGKAVRHEG